MLEAINDTIFTSCPELHGSKYTRKHITKLGHLTQWSNKVSKWPSSNRKVKDYYPTSTH